MRGAPWPNILLLQVLRRSIDHTPLLEQFQLQWVNRDRASTVASQAKFGIGTHRRDAELPGSAEATAATAAEHLRQSSRRWDFEW